MTTRLLLLFIAVSTATAFATDSPPPRFVAEHPEISSWLLGLALFGALAVVGYYVKTSDDNNRKQWNKIDNHETRLSHLEGAHLSNHGGRRDYDPDVRKDG